MCQRCIDEYLCMYCGRVLVGERARDDDGEDRGVVFIHDDVPHPVEATYDEDERPQ